MIGFNEFLRHARTMGFRGPWVATIFALQFVSVVFEGIGIGLFLPILQYIGSDGDIAALQVGSQLWGYLIATFAGIGLPVNLATLLTVSFAMFGLRQVFMYARLLFTNRVKFDLMQQIRQRAFALFVRADMAFYDRLKSGNLVNELTNELTNATGSLVAYINFMGFVLLGIVYAAWMVAFSPLMTAAAVGIFALTAVVLARLMRRSREAGKAVTTINQAIGQFLVERLRIARLIRLSGMETAEIAEVRRLTSEQRDGLVRLTAITAATQVLAEPLILFGGFTLLFVSITYLDQPLETVLVIFAVMFRMLPVVKEALVRKQTYLAALPSVEVVVTRIGELEQAGEEATGAARPMRLTHGIDFQGVRFHYPSENETKSAALDSIDLQVPAGEITAIVGPSGAGKSTLIDMIPRLRQPDEGRILYDNKDLGEFDLAALRGSVSYAPQEPLILDVSPADHIRYGNPLASQDEIHRAAELANAHEFIAKLSEGYETALGEGGRLLSGGQRQRLDLARALVRGASILILDEPTSNLDADSEARFCEALVRIRHETDIAVVIIAHRLSTIAIADRIAVMDNGKVVVVGTHQELMARGGWYARMVQQQRGDGSADLRQLSIGI